MTDRVYLCNDCGKMMYRYTNKCLDCTRTNISLHLGPEAVAAANKKSKQLAKGKTVAGQVEAFLYLSVLLLICLAIIFYYFNHSKIGKSVKLIKHGQKVKKKIN